MVRTPYLVTVRTCICGEITSRSEQSKKDKRLWLNFFQGTTIKCIVNLLKVKRSKKYGKPEEKKRVFDYVQNEVNKHVIEFIENLTNLHGENLVSFLHFFSAQHFLITASYYFRLQLYRKILEFDQNVLKPRLVAYYRPRQANIIDRHMEIELTEFAMSVKKGYFRFIRTCLYAPFTNAPPPHAFS